MQHFGIAIHGGAGTILKSEMSTEMEQAYTGALREALNAGYEILIAGGTALDAVECAVNELEDCPLFNAGRGSVFTALGTHEMDAAIMDGSNLKAGGAASVTGLKNPVSLARRIMDNSEHVLLCGKGAEDYARENGLEFCPPEYFHTDHRHSQWKQIQGTDKTILDHTVASERKFGTVGAVALDARGNLAAATSTGGMTNKRYGRIGDSPIIGAGTYANNHTCAVSCTGSGEYFIRGVAAYDVSTLMEYKGLSLEEASEFVIHQRMLNLGGDGGLIACNAIGEFVFSFNTEGMYRGLKLSSGTENVLIYK